jgi:hypoxanthine-DNA glycosylase
VPIGVLMREPSPAPRRHDPVQARVPAPRLLGLPPVVDRRTRLVVLGSFPGPASLQAGCYYGHPRNHFWPLLSALWDIDLTSLDYPQRLQQLARRRVGLWDAYASCTRVGALDQSIRAAQRNDFTRLRQAAPALRAVAHNGAASARCAPVLQALGWVTWALPSTSPANAGIPFAAKLAAWRAAFEAAGVLRPGVPG